jgi:hypothetical protein
VRRPFSFDELCEIRGDMAKGEALSRYTIVGGSARNLKAAFPHNFAILPFVEDVLRWFVRDTSCAADRLISDRKKDA